MQLEIVALNLNYASLWCSSKALFFGNEKNELQEEEAVKSNEIHDNTNLTHFHNHKLET